jgi:hypothetical protein
MAFSGRALFWLVPRKKNFQKSKVGDGGYITRTHVSDPPNKNTPHPVF